MDRLTDRMEDAFKLGLRATSAFNNARDAVEGIQAGRTFENQIGFDEMVDLLLNMAEDLSGYGMVRSNDATTGGVDWEANLESGTGDPLEKAAVLGPLMVDDYDTAMDMAESANAATRKTVKKVVTHAQVLGNVQQWLDKLYQFADSSVYL